MHGCFTQMAGLERGSCLAKGPHISLAVSKLERLCGRTVGSNETRSLDKGWAGLDTLQKVCCFSSTRRAIKTVPEAVSPSWKANKARKQILHSATAVHSCQHDCPGFLPLLIQLPPFTSFWSQSTAEETITSASAGWMVRLTWCIIAEPSLLLHLCARLPMSWIWRKTSQVTHPKGGPNELEVYNQHVHQHLTWREQAKQARACYSASAARVGKFLQLDQTQSMGNAHASR